MVNFSFRVSSRINAPCVFVTWQDDIQKHPVTAWKILVQTNTSNLNVSEDGYKFLYKIICLWDTLMHKY